MPDGVLAKDVKFLGVVNSFNEAKKFGLVACEEATILWGQEIYAYKDVLASADANVGDTIRFGVHLNTRGQPQVSLPIWKIGEDGMPIGLDEGASIINAEEAAAGDPTFLERLKEEIEGRSQQQNHKRSRMAGGDSANGWPAPGGKGKGGPAAKRQKGGDAGAWGGDAWGAGAGAGAWGGGGGWQDFQWGVDSVLGSMAMGKGGAWGKGQEAEGPQGKWLAKKAATQNGEVTLYVSGMPPGVEKREVMHIFRQYAGFTGLRLVSKEDHSIGFASFASMAQAMFVAEALTGYVFDEEVPAEQQQTLSLAPAKAKSAQR